mmetsp:Transcript_13340/g.19884  ORF Transcript_13340/g.19884 Transcript_13340/m.19884 type:complete len:876 (-) Transcript_13340:117-2744(-)|eukprot:CAMPEP_0194103930 /NCGR_PEP_ID=MMETSP0150-20130528/4284_1 /TAXON_ID=122233 /ORGANISM="Chaetoceros debilis, Strain MM31A-1" /LENGTH=875 /DNA_ID=CAMNT_0038791283 /DNA_START=94 /DNA_END=2721 /DNA_ORIENTATION=+
MVMSEASTTTNEAALAILNLKPLRDLAQNFDLDIASCLQEYLNELQLESSSQALLNDNQMTQASTSTSFGTAAASPASSPIDGSPAFPNPSINSAIGNRNGIGNGTSTSTSTSTNFTQGALLLQNSSCVYSRKVDYFHKLVYETLNSLNNNKAKDLKRRKSTANIDPDIEEFEAFDVELNFLCFGEDDLPLDKDGKKIDIKDRDDNDGRMSSATVGVGNCVGVGTSITPPNQIYNNSTHDHNNNMNNYSRLSVGGAMSITRLDQTLMNQVTHNQQSVNSHAAQALLRNLLDAHGGGCGGSSGGGDPAQATFRLMSGVCDISEETGALLMPGTGKGLIIEGDDENDNNGYDEHVNDANNNNNNDNEGQQVTSSQRLDMSIEDGQDFGAQYDDGIDDYDHGDDNGNGFVLNSPSQPQLQPQPQPPSGHEVMGNNVEGIAIHGNKVNAAAGRDVQAMDGGEVAGTEKEKEKADPWAMLDPHNDESAKSRPLRLGTTYRLPYELEKTPYEMTTGQKDPLLKRARRKIPRAKPLSDDRFDYSLNNEKCLAVEYYKDMLSSAEEARERASRRLSLDDDNSHDGDNKMELDIEEENYTSRNMVPLPMKKLAFGDEFQYILKAQAKRKAAERRKKQRLKMDQAADTQSASAVQTNERFRDIHNDEEDDCDDNDDGPAFDFAGNDDYGGDENEDVDGEVDGRSSDADAFQSIFSNNGCEDEDNQQTFEALCRAHLKEFAKGAEKFAYETQLSKRVSHWQSKIALVLDEEDERHYFDIHTYGNRIVNNAETSLQRRKSVGKKTSALPEDTVKFVSITSKQEPYEVCRTFLATLMLCNSENVAFSEGEEHTISSPDDLCIKLLSKDLDSPMESFLAPSASDQIIQT